MAFDTLIVNGTVIDGTGAPRRRADVGITGGRIEAIGSLGHAEAARRVDAAGRIVAPGFIDMHTHSDVTLLDDPGGESKAHQGVTTEVVGNCSYSPFPLGEDTDGVRRYVERNWATLDGWANALESNGISINAAPQVGNSALRTAVGALEDRPANPNELRQMQRLAAEAVEQGAFSLSTGLSVAPSSYATTDEVVALCEAIAHYDGAFYVTHARVMPGWHVKMIEEAVEIGQRAEIPVQFSHLAIIWPKIYGRGGEMVGVMERAREGGLDITYDVYPYTAAGAGLDQLVPLWVQEGGNAAYIARVRDPSLRDKIRDEMTEGRHGGDPPPWDTWVISNVQSEGNQELIGRNIAQIAEDRGVPPAEVALQLIEEEDGAVMAVVHNRDENDVRFFLGHPLAMIGSDGSAISPTGPSANTQPHPRFYGTHPRILGRYVREEPSVMSLETAVYKMTGFPAERMTMKDRGRLAEGLVADLVVFDPDTVIDRATFEEPHQFPVGIPHVFVRGEAIVSDGKHTGARPGRVLRRGES